MTWHWYLWSNDIGNLFNNDLHSDVILNVNGKKFYAHKNILAIRSEYFRTMFSIDMSESSKKEIPIVANAKLFEKLLRYIYTGQMGFTASVLNEVIGMMVMMNTYLFWDLQRSIEAELVSRLSPSTFCSIYSAAYSCSVETLIRTCLLMADDRNQRVILRAHEFSNLQVGAIKDLITRQSFDLYQPEVFTAVSEWISTNGGKAKCAKAADILLSDVKLLRMPISFLAEIVRPSGLYPDRFVSDAIKRRLQISHKRALKIISARLN